jgi:hypothetical protein
MDQNLVALFLFLPSSIIIISSAVLVGRTEDGGGYMIIYDGG